MPYEKSAYFLETDELTEVARLLAQDRSITEVAGLLPSSVAIASLHRVLDIGCGPGGWLLDLIQAAPQMAGVGVDISEQMVTIASALRKAEGRDLTFRLMDVRAGLDFPDASFDLVQMRLCHSFLPAALWPSLLQECFRVLIPGGHLWVTEYEMTVANQPATEELAALLPAFTSQTPLSFSHTGHSLGTLSHIKPLLRGAWFVACDLRLFCLDASRGEKGYDFGQENTRLLYEGLFEKLVEMGYTRTYLADLYERSCREAEQDDYTCLAILFSASGQKPEK